ncbi:hypothetical protein DSLASN_02930 [Desulfoluna limicola]|uniref:Glycosyltransferase 2-like domain-containing protein n=1 Tax=Desulfoluna limicola TaxID=2810562 RepID=A0ABM7PBU3_9BACT|nr:hypothetical protein DSLASN_02930 [Desulfoluna limicola]
MINKEISICIANYNGIDLIDSCLASIYGQSTSISYEILIHDDASTDGSADYINTKYPDVTLIRSTSNVGFCLSNNRMAEVASGKYLLLLNNDANLFSNALETLYKYSQKNSNAILGVPQYTQDTKKFIDAGSSLDFFLNAIPNPMPVTPTTVGMIIGACMWIPKQVWDKTGGFPPFFGFLAEDLYVCLSAQLMGHPVIALNHSGFYHHVGASLGGGKADKSAQLRTTINRRYHTERNKLLVMAVALPSPLDLIIIGLNIGVLLLEGVCISASKKDPSILKTIYLRAITSFFRNINKAQKLRRLIQPQRSVSIKMLFSSFKIKPQKLNQLLKHGMPSIDS